MRSADGTSRSEGSEIIAFAVPRAAMFEDLWERVVAGDEDEGEGLVVAKHHIVAGLEPLDEVGLEQQRLGLGGVVTNSMLAVLAIIAAMRLL